MSQRKHRGSAIFGLALILSGGAHIGLAAYWLVSRSGELGSVDVATNAISVNLETTDVLDSIESSASKDAASSSAGTQFEAAGEAKKSDDVKEKETVPPPKADPDKTENQEQARLAEEAAAEKQRAEDEAEKQIQEQAERDETKRRAEEEAERTQKLTEVADGEKEKHEEAQQAAVLGGEAASGSQEAESSTGHVSASQGSILNYGASLRAIISAHAPRDIRKKSLRVMFNVSPTGGLTSIDVLQSSRDVQIDSKVVELVRKLSTEFPPPPKGATANQLSYNIEIIFR